MRVTVNSQSLLLACRGALWLPWSATQPTFIYPENLHDIVNETVLEKADNKVSLKFVIPSSSDFFDGHFPEFKLLPAVAQFEIITRFSRKYFGTQRYVPSIKRIKFSAPIRPDSVIRLDLTHNVEKGTVSFTMADFDISEKVYSSGSFCVIDE